MLPWLEILLCCAAFGSFLWREPAFGLFNKDRPGALESNMCQLYYQPFSQFLFLLASIALLKSSPCQIPVVVTTVLASSLHVSVDKYVSKGKQLVEKPL